MLPHEPKAGTIAAVTARATGLPALAVAQARKNGPHGTVNRETRVSSEDNGRTRRERERTSTGEREERSPVEDLRVAARDEHDVSDDRERGRRRDEDAVPLVLPSKEGHADGPDGGDDIRRDGSKLGFDCAERKVSGAQKADDCLTHP